MGTKLSIGFSPCPNDTFIFDALVNKKIESDLDLEVVLEDVQTLNQWAIEGKLDITKVSYGVLPRILDTYSLLDAGGALGKGVGPLLISKHLTPENYRDRISNLSIAIPGENTTAHFLFSLAFPNARNKKFMIFSAIEDAVLSGKVDCGVIIHENRFTYQQKGLVKLIDLGDYWEQKTNGPIPLGGIVMKKSLDVSLHLHVNDLIRKSLQYSFDHYPQLSDYIKDHSQEMEEDVMRKHIDLYVNNYSLTLGEDGRAAVDTLMSIYKNLHKNISV